MLTLTGFVGYALFHLAVAWLALQIALEPGRLSSRFRVRAAALAYTGVAMTAQTGDSSGMLARSVTMVRATSPRRRLLARA